MISIKDNKVRWGISAVLALLVLFGTYRNVFSLAAFLGCCLIILFFEKESILLQLFFIMPMANIFKLSPGSQSFFTILILLYVVLHLVLPRRATMFVVLFGVYVVIGQLVTGQFDLFRTIKLICNVLFLSSILNSEVRIRHREIFLSYIIGNLIASIFGTMDSALFKIDAYVGVTELLGSAYEEGTERFKGLHSDPNYYAIGIVISLCLLIALYHRKEIKTLFAAIIAVPMGYFLVITYSKSAVFMLLIIIVFFLCSLCYQKKYLPMIAVLVATTVVVVLALSGQIPFFETVISRFSAADKGGEVDINTLTTGRAELWITYIKYIIKNIKIAVFGGSITAGLITHHVSHNTYIDIIYHLGAVGGFLLFASLKVIISQSSSVKIKRNVLNFSGMICMCSMYFFLGELFYYDPPFQIFVSFVLLNLPLFEKNSINLQNRY